MLSSSSLIKIKRYSSAITGENGKRGKPLYGSRLLLNMTLSLHHHDYLGWVISLMVIIPLVCHTINHFVLSQHYQFTLVFPTCSREVIQSKSIFCNTINLHFHDRHSWTLCHQWNSISKITTLISCLWCGIHQGPPAMSRFLLTSTHYPKSWLRNTQSIPWALHASMVGFLLLVIGIHQWPSTKRIFMVFNISSIHTMQNVL